MDEDVSISICGTVVQNEITDIIIIIIIINEEDEAAEEFESRYLKESKGYGSNQGCFHLSPNQSSSL